MNDILTIIGSIFGLAIITVSTIGVLKISNAKVRSRWIGLLLITLSFLTINIVGDFLSVDFSVVPVNEVFSVGFLTFLKSIIKTISLFNSSNSISSFAPFISGNIIFAIVYYLLNFISIIIWATTFLAVISIRISGFIRINLGTIFSRKNIHIFSDINKRSIILAQNVIKIDKKSLIIFISKLASNEEKSAANRLIRKGFTIANYNDDYKRDFFRRIGISKTNNAKKIHVYIFGDDDMQNLVFADNNSLNRHAMQNIDAFHKKMSGKKTLKENDFRERVNIYIRIEDRLETELTNYKNVHIVYESELTGSQLVRCGPLHKLVKKENIWNGRPAKYNEKLKLWQYCDLNIRTACIGFGRTGEEVFKKIYTDSQNVGLNLKFDIYDKSANERQGIFYNRCPAFRNVDTVNFISSSIYCDNFFKNLYDAENDKYYNYFVVNLGDDKLNCEAANRIVLFYLKNKLKATIAVHIRNKDNHIFLRKSNESVEILNFGALEDLYTVENIIQEQNYYYAKKCNYLYSKIYDKAVNRISDLVKANNRSKSAFSEDRIYDKDLNNEILVMLNGVDDNLEFSDELWRAASSQNKKSSLWVAENIFHKLHFMGSKISELYEKIENGDNTINDFLINMAKSEHLRWNAFMMVSGYTVFNQKEISNYLNNNKNSSHSVINCRRNNDVTKQTVCLVDWAKLDDVGSAFKNNFYILDHLHTILCIYLSHTQQLKMLSIGTTGRTRFLSASKLEICNSRINNIRKEISADSDKLSNLNSTDQSNIDNIKDLEDKKVIEDRIKSNSEKLDQCFNEYSFSKKEYTKLKRTVNKILTDKIKMVPQKYHDIQLLTCLADGFDILCAQVAMELEIPIEGIICKNVNTHLSNNKAKRVIDLILSYNKLKLTFIEADEKNEIFKKSSEEIVTRADLILAYDDGYASDLIGGTKWTISAAKKRGVEIVSLFDKLNSL